MSTKKFTRHGHTPQGKPSSPTYRTWRSMHIRCTKPNHVKYHRYGGRGITVCEKWKTFLGFLEDMGKRPEGTSLDRIDSSLGYFKENCRWADPKTQARDSGPIRNLTCNNRTMRVVDWARELGVPVNTLYSRVHRGWSEEDVISKPFKKRRW